MNEPNPMWYVTIIDPDEIPKYRRINCQSYRQCLDVAAKEQWYGFTCNRCMAYTEKSLEELRKEAEGIRTSIIKQLLVSQ